MSGTLAFTWAGVSSRFSQLICGLSGHELLLNAQPGRLSLKCMTCPYETPGWTIKKNEVEPRLRHQTPAVLVHQTQG
jgi:hypothetical protein